MRSIFAKSPLALGIAAVVIAVTVLVVWVLAGKDEATISNVSTHTPIVLPSPPIPTYTAMATPSPSLTSRPTSAATSGLDVSPVPTYMATPTHTFVPTSMLTPISEPSPATTRGPTYTPQPYITPASVILEPDERYGVIMHTSDSVKQKWFLDTLETDWFLDWTDSVENVPAGHNKLLYIDSVPGPTSEQIRVLAQKSPGSVWYVVGEPNRRPGYGASDIVPQLHDIYEAIKTSDPTARITSPSILNWEYTCTGCSGYQTGRSWLEEFLDSYKALYGSEPPVDIWALDVYPLDWVNRPTVDHQLAINQIDGLRQYLDSMQSQKHKPIWITELGLHWGWDDWEWFAEGCEIDGISLPSPAGTYQTQSVIDYLGAIFDWLDANANSKNVERWFLLSTYYNITTCNSSAYAGLTLFNSPEIGAALTPVGIFFQNRIKGFR